MFENRTWMPRRRGSCSPGDGNELASPGKARSSPRSSPPLGAQVLTTSANSRAFPCSIFEAGSPSSAKKRVGRYRTKTGIPVEYFRIGASPAPNIEQGAQYRHQISNSRSCCSCLYITTTPEAAGVRKSNTGALPAQLVCSERRQPAHTVRQSAEQRPVGSPVQRGVST